MASEEEQIITTQELASNGVHRTYLITYSQIDHRIFRRRVEFAAAVVQAFGAQNVEYYAVGKEPHKTGGYHYHMAIKLNKTMRWHSARDYLHTTFGINVNFSTTGQMYAGAYRYTTKNDHNAIKGNVLKKHPDLDMCSAQLRQAITANNAFRENAKQRRIAAASADKEPNAKNKKTTERLKKTDVAKFCVKNKIRDETKLMAVCVERRNLGDTCLYDFVIGMSRKVRSELVEDAWRFEEAESQLQHQNCDRITALNDARNTPCSCQGVWITLAKDILAKNEIDHVTFANALKKSILKGREKDANVLLYGPGDCGKSFILKPIIKILPLVFTNPANSQFAWKGAETSNLIFLNDLRWSPLEKKDGFISWSKFLNLLEGFEEQLPAPMNQASNMVTITKKMPIWATSNGPILYWERNRNELVTPQHKRENEMMSLRWNTFEFSHQYGADEKVECQDCCSCFAKFILDYSEL